MTVHERLHQGTTAWFEMVGTVMVGAARCANLPEDLNVSLVERYTNGAMLSEGLVQGIRFEIVRGAPSYRVGARPQERADVVIEVTANAARILNGLRSTNPEYKAANELFLGTGEMRVTGDIRQLGDWLASVHDPIVDRTL